MVEALSKKVTIGLGYKYAEFNKVLKMKKTRDFSNDLTVRLDFSFNKMQSLIRKIDTQLTQLLAVTSQRQSPSRLITV